MIHDRQPHDGDFRSFGSHRTDHVTNLGIAKCRLIEVQTVHFGRSHPQRLSRSTERQILLDHAAGTWLVGSAASSRNGCCSIRDHHFRTAPTEAPRRVSAACRRIECARCRSRLGIESARFGNLSYGTITPRLFVEDSHQQQQTGSGGQHRRDSNQATRPHFSVRGLVGQARRELRALGRDQHLALDRLQRLLRKFGRQTTARKVFQQRRNLSDFRELAPSLRRFRQTLLDDRTLGGIQFAVVERREKFVGREGHGRSRFGRWSARLEFAGPGRGDLGVSLRRTSDSESSHGRERCEFSAVFQSRTAETPPTGDSR